MRRSFLLSVILAIAVCGRSWAVQAAASRSRPANVVIILADDLGYGDLSGYGAAKLKTPNVDRLCEEGLRFTDAHATSATCTPSRYALLTGEYPWRRKNTSILPGDASLIIQPGRTTLASMLQKAGYKTSAIGKLHLGLGGEGGPDWNGVIRPGPLEIGFDTCFILPATGDRVPCVYVEDHAVAGLDPNDPIQVSFTKEVGHAPAGPLRGGKYSIFEGGTRIPFVVRWPSRVRPGVSGALVCQIDLLASLARLTGQTLGPDDAPDSLNVLPALLGESTGGRDAVVEHAGAMAFRQGPWKYIAPGDGPRIQIQTNTETGLAPQGQLYDLSSDLGETRDLASQQPDRVRQISPLLQRAMEQGGTLAASPAMFWSDTSRVGRPFAKDPSAIRWAGRYLLYYSLPPSEDPSAAPGWAIGIAESGDLTNWKKIGQLGPGQDCDRKGLAAPCAIVLNKRVHLFYQTYGNGANDALCHAVSEDGVTFARDATNPVFHPTGDWTVGRAIDAEVVAFGDRLLLFCATRDPQMKVQMITCASAALSSDFSRPCWQQIGDGPLLRPELAWERSCIEAPSVMARQARLFMFYAGAYNNEPQQIGVAASDDGLHWKRLSDQPLLPNGQPGEWNSSESGHPGVFVDSEGQTHLFFQGNNDKGHTWFLSRMKVEWEPAGPYLIRPGDGEEFHLR